MSDPSAIDFAIQHADCCDECTARAKGSLQGCICFAYADGVAEVVGCPVHGRLLPDPRGAHINIVVQGPTITKLPAASG